MAIHLLLLAALDWLIGVYSHCVGALDKVSNLPHKRIPTRCHHLDIFKNVMINCSELMFQVRYHHLRAHQDNNKHYHLLSRPLQLNCIVDLCAKRVIWGLDGNALPPQEIFPLEPIAVFVGQERLRPSQVTAFASGLIASWLSKCSTFLLLWS